MVPNGGTASKRSIVPLQAMEFALVGPIFHPGDQTLSHRIVANILPLRGVTLLPAQLGVPKIPLPEGQSRKLAGHSVFPECHPTTQRRRRPAARRAKKMHVIRHDHITSHPPMVRILPVLQKRVAHLHRGQHRLASLRADCHKNQDRTKSDLRRLKMSRSMSAWLVGHGC